MRFPRLEPGARKCLQTYSKCIEPIRSKILKLVARTVTDIRRSIGHGSRTSLTVVIVTASKAC